MSFPDIDAGLDSLSSEEYYALLEVQNKSDACQWLIALLLKLGVIKSEG